MLDSSPRLTSVLRQRDVLIVWVLMQYSDWTHSELRSLTSFFEQRIAEIQAQFTFQWASSAFGIVLPS